MFSKLNFTEADNYLNIEDGWKRGNERKERKNTDLIMKNF